MEPLVIFGAFLVVYCGYYAALDSVTAWQGRRLAAGVGKSGRSQRTSPCRAGQGLRRHTGMGTVKPLTQQRATG
jgi:hypothetical protein